jgi:hypothetical protein
MAKAQYHKNQRVFVKPIGTWALVERVVPHWTKGLEEPIRVLYDLGLGRDFGADELQADGEHPSISDDDWRVIRARNKWQTDQETLHHPFPGTYPVVLTSDAEWGGWRVPGSEYALSPTRIEKQATLIAHAPRLAALVRQLTLWAKQAQDQVPESLLDILHEGSEIVAEIDAQKF